MAIDGWLPAEQEDALSRTLESRLSLDSFYLAFDDVREDEIDDVPILLKNNRVFRAFENLTEMYSLPRYNEMDPTPVVAPFYMLFFGMMVADVGYGLVMLAALGAAGLLALAAVFAVEALTGIAKSLAISSVLLAFSVLAAVAALPEIWSSLKIIAKKRYELVMGNVFSGTAVNVLLVTGVAAMFSPLPVGASAAAVGLPFFAAAVALLTVSGFSRKISSGQGWLYLFLYLLFWAKLFQIF